MIDRFFSLWLARREVDGMDGATRANFFALTAALALGWVDVGEVAAHLDGFEWAGLHALLAADAADVAILDDQSAFVGVGAADVDAAVVLATWAHFDDAARTSLGASAATDAFLFVNFGQSRFLVDVQGIEWAFLGAVA